MCYYPCPTAHDETLRLRAFATTGLPHGRHLLRTRREVESSQAIRARSDGRHGTLMNLLMTSHSSFHHTASATRRRTTITTRTHPHATLTQPNQHLHARQRELERALYHHITTLYCPGGITIRLSMRISEHLDSILGSSGV